MGSCAVALVFGQAVARETLVHAGHERVPPCLGKDRGCGDGRHKTVALHIGMLPEERLSDKGQGAAIQFFLGQAVSSCQSGQQAGLDVLRDGLVAVHKHKFGQKAQHLAQSALFCQSGQIGPFRSLCEEALRVFGLSPAPAGQGQQGLCHGFEGGLQDVDFVNAGRPDDAKAPGQGLIPDKGCELLAPGRGELLGIIEAGDGQAFGQGHGTGHDRACQTASSHFVHAGHTRAEPGKGGGRVCRAQSWQQGSSPGLTAPCLCHVFRAPGTRMVFRKRA